MTEEERKEHKRKLKCAERARYRAKYPERVAAERKQRNKERPELNRERKKRHDLKYPEQKRARLARRKKTYKTRYPEKVKLARVKERIRKMFVGVVDAEVRKLLVETKLLQIQIKHITSEKQNEKHS